MRLSNLKLPSTKPNTPLKVYCDASHRDGGMSHAGWAFCNHNGRPLEIRGQDIGTGYTTNEAEKESMVRAIDGIAHLSHVNYIKVYSDSIHAVGQLEDSAFIEAHDGFDSIKVEWIPREQNQTADVAASMQRAKTR